MCVREANPRFVDCAWTLGTGTTVGPAPAASNSAELGGAEIGDDSFNAATHRRVVPVTVTSSSPAGLEAGPAYFLRSSGETAYLIIPVRNTGTGYPCFIRAEPYRWLNASGGVLNSAEAFAYVQGAVGVRPDGSYAMTCLGPGDTGYMTDIELSMGSAPLFSAVASVELTLASSEEGARPPGRLVPTGYTVGTCATTSRSLRIEAVVADDSVLVARGGSDHGEAILLDADGLPMAWIQPEITRAVAAPGQTVSFFESFLSLSPKATRMHVFVDFQPATAALASAPMTERSALLSETFQAARHRKLARWRAARSIGTLVRGHEEW